ncbi:MAG: signal peptidase I [Acidimicrobiales bacterium]
MSQPASSWPTSSPPEPPSELPEPRKRPSAARNLLEWVLIIAGALVVAFVVKTFLIQAFYIPSGSMLPTLQEQDRILVNKLSYDLHDVKRGDIVVFESPAQADGQIKDLVKRVIGLPGETVEAREGRILINGQPIDEGYLGEGITTGDMEPQKVPPDHYWVMGDNRGNSKDSRFFGAIDEDLIIGRAFVRVWPINHFRFY